MKNRTQVSEAEVSKLIHAEWNYKTDGTEEQIESLANAINRQKSCGVLAVREVEIKGETVLEVMDGNHRLSAIRDVLKWEKVPVENFGPLSQVEAIILTRQRNEQWFEDDKLKLANLFVDHVFPEISHEELELILPENSQQLEIYSEMAAIDWSEPVLKGEEESESGEVEFNNTKTIRLNVNEEVYNLWLKWCERAKKITGLDNEQRAFEFAVIEALNVPEENLEDGYKSEV